MKYFKLTVILFLVGAFALAPVVASAQENATYWHNKGVDYENNGNHEKAIDCFTKAVTINHRKSISYFGRANNYNYLGRYNDAIADYTKAISIDPNYSKAYNNRGFVYDKLKRYNEAIADYTKAISIDPNYSKAYNNRGFAYYHMKKYDKALEEYENAISLGSVYAIGNKAIIYMKLGKEKDAILYLEKRISKSDDNYNQYYNGCLKYLLGKNEEAIEHFTKFLEIEDDEHFQNLSYYYRGLSYKKIGEKEKTFKDLKKACNGGEEEACKELKK